MIERPTLAAEIESLLNRYSAEAGSNTPDFILAEYVMQCLKSFNAAVCAREAWYGRGEKAYNTAALADAGRALQSLKSELPPASGES